MNFKVFYRVNQDRSGIPMEYTGARRFDAGDTASVQDAARAQLAMDYQVPLSAVEICRVEQ